MKALSQYRGLNREIYLLALIRGINMTGHMFVFPFMSLFLTSVFGYSIVTAGYFMLGINALSSFANIAGGKASDIFNRKRTVLFAFIAIALLMGLTSVMEGSRIVILFIAVAYALVSFSLPGISALVLDKCTPEKEPESLSLLYLASNVGCAVGPIIAGAMFYNHRAWAFRCLAFAFVVSTLITIFLISDLRTEKAIDKKEIKKEKKSGYLKAVVRNPILFGFVIVLGISSICYSAIGYITPLDFSDMHGVELGSRLYSMIWSVNGFVIVFFTPIIISISKRHSQLINSIIGCTLYTLGFMVYAFNVSVIIYYAAVVVWTAGEILISTGAAVYIASESPEEYHGSSMGIYEFARGIGKCLGPLIFSYLIEFRGFKNTWGYISITCLVLAILLVVLYRKSQKRNKVLSEL